MVASPTGAKPMGAAQAVALIIAVAQASEDDD